MILISTTAAHVSFAQRDRVSALRNRSKKRNDPLTDARVISIVDDDESARLATDRLVRSLGWRACMFSSGEEFLRSPQLHDTSCAVVDVQMPGLGGLELQSRLNAEGHRIPIIFMTAFPEDRVRTRALAAGAICFLTKPFGGRTLIECIDAALSGAAHCAAGR
jgi:FixJ family two-component response regulator